MLVLLDTVSWHAELWTSCCYSHNDVL